MTPLQNKPTGPQRPQNTQSVRKATTPAGTPRKNARRVRRRLPPLIRRVMRLLRAKFSFLPYILPEGDALARGCICAGLILFFALLQTTVFARFRPFGAIPDLMLPLVIAIAMTEGEKWGAVSGIAAAFVIESLGSTGATLLPLFYMAAGYFCPIITMLFFTDSPPVRVLYTAVSGVARAVMTLVYLSLNITDFHLIRLFTSVVLPEYAATFCLAILPHLMVWLCLHPFHRSRAERTGMI